MKKYIGMSLFQLRESCGFSQAHVAKEMGVSQSQVSRYEQGVENMSLDHLGKYVRACGGEPEMIIRVKGFTFRVNI